MEKENPSEQGSERDEPVQQAGEKHTSVGLTVEGRERLTEFVREQYGNSMLPFHAWVRLQQSGLTDVLEEAGVLARVENPNPYDIRQKLREHDQWWSEHPEASAAFKEDIRTRDERLRLLYIGAMVGPYMRRAADLKEQE